MNTGFVDGHIEQTVDFNYDEIDERLSASERPAEPTSDPSQIEVISAAKLLHHIITIGCINPRETMLWVNVFLFIMGIHPNQSASGVVIANGLKLSKAEYFRRCSKMRRILKARGLTLPRIAGEWGRSGRASIANTAVRSWQKRGGQPMLKISEADKKLNWIADHLEKLNWAELPPLARQELKCKLKPILTIMTQL